MIQRPNGSYELDSGVEYKLYEFRQMKDRVFRGPKKVAPITDEEVEKMLDLILSLQDELFNLKALAER